MKSSPVCKAMTQPDADTGGLRQDEEKVGKSMTDSEIDWHRGQIGENRTVLEELEAGNQSGGDVFPETQAEMDRLKAQIEQSELIVAAYEKQHES
jgi:hypothetical protein